MFRMSVASISATESLKTAKFRVGSKLRYTSIKCMLIHYVYALAFRVRLAKMTL